jgi:RHS repeat-associated protein
MTGYVTGDNNQLLSDGTYDYEYDAEGNRTVRTDISTGATTTYDWDFRNRLIRVTDRDETQITTQVVEYTYDVFDRRIGRAVDTSYPFDLSDAAIERYILDDRTGIASPDGGNVILDFVDPDGEGEAALELARRYLFGNAVDQILAQENTAEDTSDPERTVWPLGDHLQTTRDLASNDSGLVEHHFYDSYGQITSGNTGRTRFLFTAREFDDTAGLQYNRARSYDPATGVWVSEDPMLFLSSDTNAYRMGRGALTMFIDPNGMMAVKYYPGPPSHYKLSDIDTTSWTAYQQGVDTLMATMEIPVYSGPPPSGQYGLVPTTYAFGVGVSASWGLGCYGSVQIAVSVPSWNPLTWEVGIIDQVGLEFNVPDPDLSFQGLVTVSNATSLEELAGQSGQVQAGGGVGYGGSVTIGNLDPVVGLENINGARPTTVTVGAGMNSGFTGGVGYGTTWVGAISLGEVGTLVSSFSPW